MLRSVLPPLLIALSSGCKSPVVSEAAFGVVFASPSDGAAQVDPLSDIRVLFNDEVLESSVSAATTMLEDADGMPVPSGSTLDEDGTTVILDPQDELEPATTYTALFNESLQGISTGRLGSTFAISFTTLDPDAEQTAPSNQRPTADAGPDLTGIVGSSASLSAGASSDPDGDTITASWSLASRPVGSQAAIEAPEALATSLPLDLPGEYIVQLIVSDGELSSDPDYAIIFAE